MSFPPEFLDTLRTRVSIAEVIGRRVSFDPRKSNPRRRDYWACCPFHGEKTPSFHVDDGKGFYHCFGCGAHGDAIGFLEAMDGLSFVEAVERLAAEAGLSVPKPTREAAAAQDRRHALEDVLGLAQTFFTRTLAGRSGAPARAYLENRGCGPALWHEFGLGFAPAARTALFEHLRAEGVDLARMIEAGLVGTADDGAVYDRFRDRIQFPIRDGRDRLVGFGGRTMRRDPDTPKYLNSPETALFHKGRLLFNLARARGPARDAGTLIVAEGYMDVIALHGAGFGHAVAPLGTALTPEQLALLWRVTPEPILCFDGDAAGLRAARRAADLALPALRPGISVRFALLPEGQDPDDVIRSAGPSAMAAILADPQPLVDLLWERELSAGPLDTPERCADLEQRLGALARRIEDASVRGHYGQAFSARLAERLRRDRPGPAFRAARPRGLSITSGNTAGISSRTGPGASGALKRTTVGRSARGPVGLSGEAAAQSAFWVDAEAILLAILLDQPRLLDAVGEVLAGLAFSTPQLDRIGNELIDLASLGTALDRVSLRGHLESRGILELVDSLAGREIVRRMRRSWADADDTALEQLWRKAFDRHSRARRLRAEEDETLGALDADAADAVLWRRLEAIKGEWRRLEAELAEPMLDSDRSGEAVPTKVS